VALPFAALLIRWGGAWGCVCASVALVCFAVWCCGAAERVLQARDPGYVVLDEFVAVPCCYLVPLFFFSDIQGLMTASTHWLSGRALLLHLGVFALFRVFDIFKPWPVGPSQKWPRGWGVVMDDVLAAGYVNLVLGLVLMLF